MKHFFCLFIYLFKSGVPGLKKVEDPCPELKAPCLVVSALNDQTRPDKG